MPPLVASNSPARLLSAPVNAPFSWPKSSLSRIVSGKDPQLIGVKGFPARLLCSCMARATSSFPVPLAPVISTLAVLGATRAMAR